MTVPLGHSLGQLYTLGFPPASCLLTGTGLAVLVSQEGSPHVTSFRAGRHQGQMAQYAEEDELMSCITDLATMGVKDARAEQ